MAVGYCISIDTKKRKKYGCDIKSIVQLFYSIHKKGPNDFLINGLMELLDQYQRLEIAYYQRKLKEGKTKGQALVCIMRRLVNIIYGMMKNKTVYESPIIEEKEVV